MYKKLSNEINSMHFNSIDVLSNENEYTTKHCIYLWVLKQIAAKQMFYNAEIRTWVKKHFDSMIFLK